MKRTRAQNPKLQDPQDPSAAAVNPTANTKPQRKAKQPRQPKAAGAASKKTSAAAAAREAAAAATASASAAASAASVEVEMAPVVPDVGGVEAAGGLPADWDEMDGGLGANVSPWWTFGVEEEKLLGWFPFVEEDFCGGCHAGLGGGREPEPAGFDDDIWRIHQIYEIPSYAGK